MAALTTVALVGAGIAAAAGGAQAIGGAVRAKRAKRDMENYQRQEITDLSKGLRVSTLGAEAVQAGAAQTEATQVEALQAAGARGVLGGLTAVGAQKAKTDLAVASNLDEQMARIQQAQYGEKVRGFNVLEARQAQEIAGMAAEMQAGRQAVQQGLGTVAGAATSAAGTIATNNTNLEIARIQNG